MSSRAFNIADHMKNLQGTRTLASGAKIVGADADSIQAPGLITSAGGGDNTSFATELNSNIKGAINATGSAPIYAGRAFANFDGTSVTNVSGEDRCTIRSSGNISKIVRVGTGKYKVVFTTALPNANYAVVGNHAEDGEDYGNYGAGSRISIHNRPVRTVNEFYMSTYVDSTGFYNMRQLDIIVFG